MTGSLLLPGVTAKDFQHEAMEILQQFTGNDLGKSEIELVDDLEDGDSEIQVKIRVNNYSQVFAGGNEVYIVPLDGYGNYVQTPC